MSDVATIERPGTHPEPAASSVASATAADAASFPLPSTAAAQYSVLLLTVIYMLNFVDRQIVNILAEPIKRDLGLADWQLGAMTGLGFAMLYTTLGIPMARLAERYHRGRIIAGCLVVWLYGRVRPYHDVRADSVCAYWRWRRRGRLHALCTIAHRG